MPWHINTTGKGEQKMSIVVPGPIVELRDVVKNYTLGETKVAALRGATLSLNRGEFTAVIGASGSGKSTLLNMIGCIDQPDSGVIKIDDIEVTHLTDNDKSRLRNKKIGFIFQSFQGSLQCAHAYSPFQSQLNFFFDGYSVRIFV